MVVDRSVWAAGLLWIIALSAGLRESVLSVAAFVAACWMVYAWWANRAQWSNQPAWAELRWVAVALALYFVLHLIRLDSERGLARLDGPVRALLMAPLLILPWLAAAGWPVLRRMVAGCGMAMGLASLAMLALHPSEPRIYGLFTYHNLAGYSAVAVVGILICTREPVGQALLSRAAVVLGLVAALLTGTMGALLALPLAVAVALWRHRAHLARRLGSRAGVALLLVLVAILVTTAPRLQDRLNFVAENLQTGPNATGYWGSGAQRLAMWKVSWAMIQDRPVLGHGLDAFPDQMQPWADRLGLGVRFGIEGFGHGGFRNPHNLLLGWAATLGVPTALLLVALFWGAPLWAAWRMRRHATAAGAQEAGEAFWALAVLMGLLFVFGLTESVLERQRGITWFLCWALLILGSLAVSARRGSSP